MTLAADTDVAFLCMDCGVDTSFLPGNGDYYMLHDAVWLRAVPGRNGMLCLKCCEARLGRALLPEDFRLTPLELFERLVAAKLRAAHRRVRNYHKPAKAPSKEEPTTKGPIPCPPQKDWRKSQQPPPHPR